MIDFCGPEDSPPTLPLNTPIVVHGIMGDFAGIVKGVRLTGPELDILQYQIWSDRTPAIRTDEYGWVEAAKVSARPADADSEGGEPG